jgi:hypothetical protein
MTILFYLNCFVIAVLGELFAVLLQLKSQSNKAKQANLVQPTFGSFVKEEWINISISMVVIVLAMFFVPIIMDWKPDSLVYIRPAFLPIGYMGTDVLLKLFGVVNKRLNSAIDYKTTEADKATGNLDNPTPAEPVKKP